MTDYPDYPSYPNPMPPQQSTSPKSGDQFVTRFATGSAVIMAIAIACCTPSLPARASLFDGPVDRLPSIQRNSLRNGQSVVTGAKGKYVARVLITASPDVVWKVLTDYGNLSKFIPNMKSSRVIESRGNRKIIEQVDARQVFLVSVVSRTKLAVQETDRKQIDFRLLDGDLAKMEGYWKMELVSTVPRRPPTQVLITYTVNAQPKGSVPTEAFYTIFKDSLDDTLQAIKQEVNRRT